MVGQRNRIVALIEYLKSLGIDINVGKNKARGHKGIFMRKNNSFRIDISKCINEEERLSVILHELAHFIHYSYDKNLKSLDFAFGDLSDEIREELIKITVNDVPKNFAVALYNQKQQLNKQIKYFSTEIKQMHPDFKLSSADNSIEKSFSFPLKYLLKYDRVKFLNKIYDIDSIERDSDIAEDKKLYLLIKSKQRALKRVNSRINKLNKYYNNPSELFARFLDSYYTKPENTKNIAPNAYKLISESNIEILKNINEILS